MFRRGKTYKFEYTRRKCGTKVADGADRKVSRYSFDREVKADGVVLYLFHHANAGYTETFTPCQLSDYNIEKTG